VWPPAAFLSTWTPARQTFGSGSPEAGAQFDAGTALRQLQCDVERAAPDERWQGTAANAYAAVNADHAKVFGALADLDTSLAVEVDNSARIVTAGR
jgi:EspA/EspE family